MVLLHMQDHSQCSKMLRQNKKSTFSSGQGDDGAGELPFATWDVVRSCIKEALTGEGDVPSPVPLSNIKRLFRTRFNTELSETALGHSKLSELLQDFHLNEICTVRLLDQGYFVIPLFKCDKEEDTDAPSHDSASDVSGSQDDLGLPLNTVQWKVRNTFIDVSPPVTELPRSKSLSELEKSSSFLESFIAPEAFELQPEIQQRVKFCVDEPLEIEECSGSLDLPAEFQSLGFVVQNTFIDATTPHSSSSKRSLSLPKKMKVVPHDEQPDDFPSVYSPTLTASPGWTPNVWNGCASMPLLDKSKRVVHLSEFV